MSSTSSFGNAILDTFKINSSGIFLKDFHIQRTTEAFQCLGTNLPISRIHETYNLVEKENSPEMAKIGRLIFQNPTCGYSFEIFDLDPLASVVKLQPILELKQPSGVGSQNYKWLDRNFWNQMKILKSTAADDVLTVNEKMQVVETSRFNLFFYDARKNEVLTPPLASGCIHGVYRRWALANKVISLPKLGPVPIFEKDVLFSEINRYQIFVANSVREVLSAELTSP